jgi:hypothetical protein
VINNTTTRALLRNKTLFEVWFGWKPRWIEAEPPELLEDDNDDGMGLEGDSDSDSDSELDDDDLVLTKIEA